MIRSNRIGCAVSGCLNSAWAEGLCSRHWSESQASQKGKRICTKCQHTGDSEVCPICGSPTEEA